MIKASILTSQLNRRKMERKRADLLTLPLRSLVSICRTHKEAGHEPPTRAEAVRNQLRAIRRTQGTAQNGKTALTVEQLQEMMAVLDRATLQGRRDRALLLLGFAGAFRRSDTDKSGLEWYSRRLSQIRNERESIKAQAVKMIAAFDADEADLTHLYEAEAQAATAALLQAGGNRRKSVEPFYGTFGLRTVPGGYAVTDWEAALPHAQAMGRVRVDIATEACLLAAQARLEETGELLPGVEKVEAREAFGLSLPKRR